MLRWANRREVAREVTRRGYRVSGETLNLWVRQEKEFPAVVERIVFDLFTIGQDTAKEPPPWAEALARDTARQVIEALAPPEIQRAAQSVIERLEDIPPPNGDSPHEEDEATSPGGGEPRELARE